MKITLIPAGTAAAANSAPSGASAGKPIRQSGSGPTSRSEGIDQNADEGALVFKMIGSGVLTVAYLRLWLYYADIAEWVPAGTGDDADKGKLNADASTPFALGETSADVVAHVERIRGFGEANRIYVEVGAVGGTPTTMSCFLLANGQKG